MFATTLHALGVAAIAGAVLAPGASVPAATAELNSGVTWFEGSAASAAPGSTVSLTPVHTVTGTPPEDAELGFTVSYPVGLTVEAAGGTCTVDEAVRTVSCSGPPDGGSPQLQASVDPAAVPGTTLALTARVSSVPGDVNPADDEATTVITVVALQSRLRVSGPASAPEGETFAVRVVLSNDSDADLGSDFRGQASMNVPDGGEDLYTWVSLPPGCFPDPLSFSCGEPGDLVPAGESRTFDFRITTLPGAAGKVFTLSAEWRSPVRESADVRITAPAVTPAPVDTPPVDAAQPGDGTPVAEGAGAPSAAELPATGAATLPLTALGLGLVVLGVALTRARRVVGRLVVARESLVPHRDQWQRDQGEQRR